MSKFRLDEVDHQILDMLIDNTRIPFTDIAKKLLISAGTVHVRVKKMEKLLCLAYYMNRQNN
jgi:Lrp/AsnC family transcriptional regulator for asnA, asnC and gidA